MTVFGSQKKGDGYSTLFEAVEAGNRVTKVQGAGSGRRRDESFLLSTLLIGVR